MALPARHFIAAFLLGSTFLVGNVVAQTSGHSYMDHSEHITGNPQVSPSLSGIGLTEPGQGAFAALSEIVRALETDPTTDWSSVNLTALRNHLIDMDRLMRDAIAKEEVLSNGLRTVVTGDTLTLATIRRMVPVHAKELSKDNRWKVDAQVTGTNVVLTVVSDDPVTIARIQGLGFFGLMASKDHHRAHHIAFALGAAHEH